MDFSGLNGTARMAYLTGMQVLQEKGSAEDRMLLAAKQAGTNNSSFAQMLMQYGQTLHQTKNTTPNTPKGQRQSQPKSANDTQPVRQSHSLATASPTPHPTLEPTTQPSAHPTGQTAAQPSAHPTGQSEVHPTPHPTAQPTNQEKQPYSLADPHIAAARAELATISWHDSAEYLDHLKEKYGVVRLESVPRDQASLDRAGGTMRSGQDVIISPVALDAMAGDPEKAARIEGTIDYFFSNIPKYEAEAAAVGLTFESCGCVVHDDGTVTYICGGGDPPERVAEVERIHREKLEKEAAMRKYYFDKAQERAQAQREQEQKTAIRRHMTVEQSTQTEEETWQEV